MRYPFITIDLDKITANTRAIAELCRSSGVTLTGVTKATCADIGVAKAMVAGGASILGDSRVQNLKKLKDADIAVPLMLLRIPMLSEVEDTVTHADFSLVSELSTAAALSRAAKHAGTRHKIIQMVDMGDLREGLSPQKILPQITELLRLPGIELVGLGTNFACYGGLVPTPAALEALLGIADQVRKAFVLELPIVSGGNSANINLLSAGLQPRGVSNLRIGEGILLGRETVNRGPIAGTRQDAFTLHTEIVEIQEKPSVPAGQTGQDAFGRSPRFVDRGIRQRAIVAIGRQDVEIDGLAPLAPGVEILGGSSDHLILDVSDCEAPLAVGDEVRFGLQYSALVPAMISPYVAKTYRSLP